MAADVACHLSAAGGVPDVDGVMQVKVLSQVGKVVGVVVHVVALAGLCGAAVPAPVMGDHPVAVAHDDESGSVLAAAQKRHNRNLTAICRHLGDIGALRDDVDARLATRIITYYYGIDGLLRTRDVFGWSLERSNEWLLAHASAAVLRSPAEPPNPN